MNSFYDYIYNAFIFINDGKVLILNIILFTVLFFLSKKKNIEATTLSDREILIAKDRVTQLELKNENLEYRITELERENSKLSVEKDMMNKYMSQYEVKIQEMASQSRKDFENMANKIFDNYSDRFNKNSTQQLHQVLSPLANEIQRFEKRVEESFNSEAKERFALKREVENVIKSSENICIQAENLAKALKGNVKLQGDWGEMILEKILEDSGLRKEKDYTLQGINMKLLNDDGDQARPDAIIHLPGNKHIIIDAKLSLGSYQSYINDSNSDEKEKHLKSFISSVRRHVTMLADKHYHKIDKITTPDFVLMFIPIESSYSLAIKHDPDLHKFAWDRRIVISHPATLFATLQIVSSIWRVELQQNNATKIAEESGKLYDKFISFLDDMEIIDRSIMQSRKSFDKAINKLHTGKGNIVSKCEKIRHLGANSNKKIPGHLLGHEEVTDAIELQ